MHRIDEDDAAGLFTEGNPSIGQAATKVTDDWLNDVQENLADLVEGSGGSLVKGTYTQVRTAVNALIAAQNTYARYKTAAGQTIADSGVTIVNFDSSDIDNRSAVTTGASWKFTVPAGQGGVYQISALLTMVEGNGGINFTVDLFKNGTVSTRLAWATTETTSPAQVSASGTTIISLAAGDYIDLRAAQDVGSPRILVNDSKYNHISIQRVS